MKPKNNYVKTRQLRHLWFSSIQVLLPTYHKYLKTGNIQKYRLSRTPANAQLKSSTYRFCVHNYELVSGPAQAVDDGIVGQEKDKKKEKDRKSNENKMVRLANIPKPDTNRPTPERPQAPPPLTMTPSTPETRQQPPLEGRHGNAGHKE